MRITWELARRVIFLIMAVIIVAVYLMAICLIVITAPA